MNEVKWRVLEGPSFEESDDETLTECVMISRVGRDCYENDPGGPPRS